ncbi:MAG: alanine--tRNA ligase [Oscillospiraceae bacterium]|nr:alanine--tRNA ligase [Oscillospiraceae bacterium]
MNLRDLYIDFFISKGHKQIPSASLIPENDPSVLFNTAGMQPLIPFLKGMEHPLGKRLCDYQKCIRTNDLDSIGDTTHHTFFEMLGNWSLGDYFKKESIAWSFEFLTKKLNIPLERLAITVFEGNHLVNKDIISAKYWMEQGIPESRIAYLNEENNWWPNMRQFGPCGPDTEIFYWRSDDAIPEKFNPSDERWVEIWNNVFIQYNHNEDETFEELIQKNVDTGMGYERTVAILEGKNDNYESSVWNDIIEEISNITKLSYKGNEVSMRIIADHIRTAVFILADPAGIKPSNTDQGYILRRLIRRAIRHARKLNIDISTNWEKRVAEIIINQYSKYYNELRENREIVFEELSKEKLKFNRTIEKGLKEFGRLIDDISANKEVAKGAIDAINAFKLYDTFGFPIELTEEIAKEKGFRVDSEGFRRKFKEHQEKSRAGANNKFKGGLMSNSEVEKKYHTATHLLNSALKIIISNDIHQRGSNITEERLRFDFNCNHKLTDNEIKNIEGLINKWIEEGIEVNFKNMSKEEAIKIGAECVFIDKYPDIVTVYFIGNISKELCGGPHVKNTNELGEFKIIKEEASSSGIRRIKAVLK